MPACRIDTGNAGDVYLKVQLTNKYETNVSYSDLCSIASTACDMHVEEILKACPGVCRRQVFAHIERNAFLNRICAGAHETRV